MPVLTESFSVPNGAQSWAVVTDLNKLIPCVPGAKVTATESPTKATAEITVKMGSMGMVFTGPVEIVSTNGQTAQIKANTREKGGQSNAAGDVTISVSGNSVDINANAQVSGKAGSMGEGTVVAVLTQLVKSFAGNLAKA
jgi:carbon monoxide dehydrogenase subunit G